MKDFINWLKGSADNRPGGASSKKLSAFWTLVILVTIPVLAWTVWAYKHDDWGLLTPILSMLLISIVTYLGINSNEKIKGKADNTEPTDENKKADV